MKRDLDVIRAILLALEEQEDMRGINAKHVEAHSPDVVNYNAALLIEAGFVDGAVSKTIGRTQPPPVHAHRLTWSGHELLDALRPETVFEQTKSAMQKVGSFTFGTLRKVAEGLMVKMAQQAAGLDQSG